MEVFACQGVSRQYQGVPTIEDISLSLQAGELVSLLGISGVGKTTLFHILAGVDSPDSGQVLLEGTDITGKPGKVGYMLQKDLLLQHKTILDNVCLPLIIQGQPKKSARATAQAYFKQFGLASCEQQYPSQLSGGMRQRAALLRTFLMGHKVVLLDEPFSALDPHTRTQMREWYQQISQEMGLTTLLITHDIDEALLLSGRVYMMAGKPGRIVAEIAGLESECRADLLGRQALEAKRQILSWM